ncbi:MAG TPA: DUF4340 domain-containing protein [Steroidobacteraceae bacterium]|nr:DUF4340 domain-containing protein [Steroidobacteraceae bacterium]
MRRSIPLLIVLLAVQLGLAGLLAMRRNPLASIPPQSPLIGPAAQSADRLLLEGHADPGAPARVEIAKRNGQWVLPGYFNAPADKFKVEDLLSELADLRRGLPIATSSSALERFKLADDDFERRLTLSQGSHTVGKLYFGTSAGARRTDARNASDHAVYSVDLATYELPTQLSSWFANDLLESQPDQLTGVDIQMPQGALHLARQSEPAKPGTVPSETPAAAKTAKAATAAPAVSAITPAWSAADVPAGRHLDEAKVEALTHTIGDLRLQGVLGTSAQPDWQQAHPLLTLTLHRMQHADQSWVISQPAGAQYYVLKASSQPWYFSVDASTGKQLLDAATPVALLVQPPAQGKPAKGSATSDTRSSPTAARGRILTIHHLPRSHAQPAARGTGAQGAATSVAH